MITPEQFIKQYDPCNNDARSFLMEFDSLENAWNNCKRGDWMLLALAELKCEIKLLVSLAVHVARHTPLADGRRVCDLMGEEARNAIAVTERWLNDETTIAEVNTATDAAALTSAADFAYTIESAEAAFHATKAAKDTEVADAAFYATEAAFNATDYAVAEDAEDAARRWQADYIRKQVSWSQVQALANTAPAERIMK